MLFRSTVSVGNSLIKGTLKLVKKDQHGKLLNGIEFVLKKGGRYVTANGGNSRYTYTGLADNKEAATKLKTDENGRLEISGLLWGTYYLEEVNTPAGLIAGDIKEPDKMVWDLESVSKEKWLQLISKNIDNWETPSPFEGSPHDRYPTLPNFPLPGGFFLYFPYDPSIPHV